MRLTTLNHLVSGCFTAHEFDWRLQHAQLSMIESRVDGASLVSLLDIDNIVVWSTADLRDLCAGIFEVGCETAITFVFRQCLWPVQPAGHSFTFPLFKRGAEMFSLRIKVVNMTTSVSSCLFDFFCKVAPGSRCSPFISELTEHFDRALHSAHASEQQVFYSTLIKRHDVVVQPKHLEFLAPVCSAIVSRFLIRSAVFLYCNSTELSKANQNLRKVEVESWNRMDEREKKKAEAGLVRMFFRKVETQVVVAIGAKIDDISILQELLDLNLGRTWLFANSMVSIELHFGFVYQAVLNSSRAGMSPDIRMVPFHFSRDERVNEILPNLLSGATVFPTWFARVETLQTHQIAAGDFGGGSGPFVGGSNQVRKRKREKISERNGKKKILKHFVSLGIFFGRNCRRAFGIYCNN